MGAIYNLLLVFIVAITLNIPAYGQGVLFTREEANERFGPVFEKHYLEMDLFQEFLEKAGSQLMFKIVDNQVYILDEHRNLLFPASGQVSKEDVFTVYSIIIINELFSKGGSKVIEIEQREDVLSISVGEFTMEFGAFCPPFCS